MNTSRFKILTVISALLSLASLWTGCSCDSSAPVTHFPINVGERPESITRGFGGNFYVTVMNGTEEGDGVVKMIRGDDVTIFATGLNEPKGITFVDQYLVASDLDRVVKIDSHGKTSVLAGPGSFPYPPSYFNDVATDADNRGVYVTDMGANTKMRDSNGNLWPLDSPEATAMPNIGRVYHVDMNGKVTVAIDASPLMPNPNGVSVGKDGQLLVGAFFKGNFLVQRDGKLTILANGFRGADAVEQDKQGNYYVSSWSQGKVWKLSENGSSVVVLGEGFQSAADFFLDEDNKRILLPDMLAGTINEISVVP